MSQNNRIFRNATALYTRSLLTIAMALFSSRWVLEALGTIDFGLFGVIGSSVLLVTLISAGMSAGVARFYAYAVGQIRQMPPDQAQQHMSKWFNTALCLHLALGLVILTVGYPLGNMAVHHWLTIPTVRVEACHMVMLLVLITTAFNVSSIPYVAFFNAYQDIAELSLYGLATTVVTTIGAYTLLHIDSDRLIAYAIIMSAANCGCRIIQIARCYYKYPGCRINTAFFWDRKYLSELFSYVGWKMFGMTCVVLRLNSTPVLVNLFLGPQMNAAYAIAHRVSLQAEGLSSATNTAFQPAIVTHEGSGNRGAMLKAALKSCKLGALMSLMIALPLYTLMDQVLDLWLTTPPMHAGMICKFLLVALAVDKATSGQMMAVNATGKVKFYEIVQGSLLVANIPLMALLLHWNPSPTFIGISLLASMSAYCTGRLVFAKTIAGMPILPWLKKVALPILLTAACAHIANITVYQQMAETIFAIPVIGSIDACILALSGWFLILDNGERTEARNTIARTKSKFASRFA